MNANYYFSRQFNTKLSTPFIYLWNKIFAIKLENWYDPGHAVSLLEKWCKNKYFTICVDFDEYESGFKSIRRLFVTIIIKIILLISAIRWLMLVIISPSTNKLRLQRLLCDPIYMMGNPQLVGLFGFLTIISTIMITMVICIYEYTNK